MAMVATRHGSPDVPGGHSEPDGLGSTGGPGSRDGQLAIVTIRGASSQKTFFWEFYPKCRWVAHPPTPRVGWLIPKQGPNPSTKTKCPENRLFDPNFTFRSPKSHKNPGVGGWEGKHI